MTPGKRRGQNQRVVQQLRFHALRVANLHGPAGAVDLKSQHAVSGHRQIFLTKPAPKPGRPSMPGRLCTKYSTQGQTWTGLSSCCRGRHWTRWRAWLACRSGPVLARSSARPNSVTSSPTTSLAPADAQMSHVPASRRRTHRAVNSHAFRTVAHLASELLAEIAAAVRRRQCTHAPIGGDLSVS